MTMISVVQQTISLYLTRMKAPNLDDIKLTNEELGTQKGSCFVTFFLKGEVRGSAGNIKETGVTLAEELIINTVTAMTKDSRFKPLSIAESQEIKLRVDYIKDRKVLNRSEEDAKNGIQTLSRIDPIKSGVIVIKKDYSRAATILPNIDPKILTGSDYQDILSAKLEEVFEEDKYIIYEIETTVERDY